MVEFWVPVDEEGEVKKEKQNKEKEKHDPMLQEGWFLDDAKRDSLKKDKYLQREKSKADFYFYKKDYSNALQVYIQILEIQQKSQKLSVLEAILYCLLELKQFQNIQEYIHQLKSIPESQKEVNCWFLLGKLYYRTNDLQSCLYHLQHAITLNTRHVMCWYLLGKTYFKLNQLQFSQKCFDQTLFLLKTRNPNNYIKLTEKISTLVASISTPINSTTINASEFETTWFLSEVSPNLSEPQIQDEDPTKL